MDNLNIDKNTMDKLNSMLNNGNLNDMLSQIPPDTIKNFSNMLNGNQSATNQNENLSKNGINKNNSTTEESTNTNNNNQFDLGNIDINTIMKLKTVMEKMNNTSDPRKNLLQSLKPYLREGKKDKLDQYSNLLNMTSLIELFNQNNNKESPNDKQ